MISTSLLTAAALALHVASGQAMNALPASTTLPIVFTRAVDANHSHVGDVVEARTTEVVQLPNGDAIPAGATVTGHVVAANGFQFDSTPYAKQTASELGIRFESVIVHGQPVALKVYLRAMADPISSWDARKPRPSDEDPDGTLTQVGGELYKPHEGKVINMDEDVVGYSRHGNIVAHLIAAQGNSPEGCDGGDTEQPVAIFSASACGLYGFSGTTLVSSGRSGQASTIVLHARRNAVVIWKNTTALIEVSSDTQ
jgi:hypothetical protein